MTEDDGERDKKEHEPIAWACFIVFLIASVAVLGGFVNDHYVQDTNVYAEDGDTVVVNYTLSLYNYYGESGAVVYDTSYYSIASDSSILKANDFTLNSETSYATLSFTLGKTTTYLAGFMNATVGHHAGETVKVCLPVGEGYVSADTVKTMTNTDVQTVTSSEVITAAEFKDLFGYTLTTSATVVSAYGWNAVATFDAATDTVTLSYLATAGETYTAYDGSFGTVTVTVKDVTASTISYTMAVTKCVATGATEADGCFDVEMIKLDFGNDKVMYITAVDNASAPTSFEYKTVEEKYNVPLYFTIHIESVTSS